ncbi:MAG: DUF58 domain-containing protein [Actinomycetaceae bacterium]|nr:DUF58 domain-containing protein [Actinomycetaceae bacterium]MDO5747007.1 DUF58 domain-containing protein [Actinomycetaceae bacterium]
MFVLIIIAVSAFAALRYDWLEAWIIAIMTAFVFMLSFVWMLRQVDLGIEMDLASSRIRVGDHAVGTLTIHARSKTPAFGTEVVMPVAHFSATFPLPLLHAGQNHVETFTIPARRRGVIQIGPVTTIHSDPLQLLQRSKTWNSPHQLYIHPSTIGLAHSVTGLLRDIEGASTRDLTSSDVSFHALRDYTPGDERRSIHWKTTAKMGRMMVRQFEETRRAQLLCILSLHPSFYFSEDEFELAVSVAASVGAHALHEGKTVSLVTDTTTFHVPNAMRFLDELSSVELSSQPMALPELVSHGVASLPQASVIMCITGSGTSVSLLHQAYSRMSINMQSIMCRSIDPGSTENPTPIREAPYFRPVPHQFHKVGVMNIIDIGDLSELPGLMGAVGR